MKFISLSKHALILLVLSVALIGCGQQQNEQANAEASSSEKEAEQKAVGIIGPMKEEIKTLKEDMTVENKQDIAGMTFYEGTLKDQPIVLVQSGIGKVNATMASTLLINEFDVDKLINSGISGAIHPDVELGDIVISKDTVQHDMDETAKGFEPGIIPRLEKGYFKADEQMVKLAEKAAKQLPEETQVFTQRIASGDQFIANEEKKQWILDTFNAYVVEMEGAAVGQVAHLNDVPYIVIRSASDDAGEEAVMKWEEFKAQAIDNSTTIIKGMLDRME
ncbi:5'-methylthioadenosine/adenosylhomocysteine nucleosidase [Pontibacillus yanchengensis]|uniref:adenosylhomocysteine nucleosidase n=1 Tax=Pontibacillus yanchengensis Y32 TaxID=1385514 RepID=A0A0A2TE40_9BACI|nr:5'-methylthioadenosine/adenosylhomocysteine nucleosidase [Pontibacillus yanchengensis]KGP74117.1 S-adenosylhomocysteine nucleosidase [Pontibacillus yanchengensis Y32]